MLSWLELTPFLCGLRPKPLPGFSRWWATVRCKRGLCRLRKLSKEIMSRLQRRSVNFFKLIWNICLFSSSSSIKISSLKICSHQDLDIFLMLRWRLVSSSRRFWIHQTSQFWKCGKMDGDPLIRLAKSFSKLCGYLPQKLHKNNMYICIYVHMYLYIRIYTYVYIYIPFNCSVIE